MKCGFGFFLPMIKPTYLLFDTRFNILSYNNLSCIFTKIKMTLVFFANMLAKKWAQFYILTQGNSKCLINSSRFFHYKHPSSFGHPLQCTQVFIYLLMKYQ